MLLAIDTSLGTSVGVLTSDGQRFDATSPNPLKHAEVIGELIVSALSQSGVSAEGVTGVVVGMGPGPFTGLRVGIAAAEAFAAGRGVPLYRVVSHDGVVEGFPGAEGEHLLVVTDARRREVYWSRYVREGDTWRRVHGPAVGKAAELPEGVPVRDGNEAGLLATNLAVLATRMRAEGTDFVTEGALYLRSPDVTPSTGPKRVTR
ncbi:tRNA (adenosine(37)-N6)-threonylcarbamoyltransferase complex dimerization subunit type 1 TsaB [Klugiella xanthotipulae]|uniref:tRNA (adenosine(37)-N6)-threonylcarbamoyltransferase complex dimerization subunit type 1 TsaB n=1 Tax=Klugiella xanthotipulae TaxID=244735 RepID=UPI00115229C1|nr:tRNA (adenosine(37)-N6)-threonylcarbamoyltransferase complex dimerization subunit type 1 TsaB [Klugiella xanthotipulae]